LYSRLKEMLNCIFLFCHSSCIIPQSSILSYKWVLHLLFSSQIIFYLCVFLFWGKTHCALPQLDANEITRPHRLTSKNKGSHSFALVSKLQEQLLA
jgi:hypothetical protein